VSLLNTNYDPIAEQYQRSKQQPWRTHIEAFTLMQLIGDPTGKAVLDVACGEGFYARLIRQRGATKVVGVDLSAGMVELARKQEAAHGLGIEYVLGDARSLELPPEFDVVVAAYLLNYARDRDELAAMCRGIARVLKRGGRFVTVNCNPALDFRTAPSYRKYGFETSLPDGFREGSPITWTFYLEDGPFSIENYYLDVPIHEQALRAAGMSQVRWREPQLAATGADHGGPGHWDDFLMHPPATFIECRK
jgi:ubiquinone/menaquinone biosynthesis C-methylase UbiE